MPSKAMSEWMRPRFFPHMWCPGCGHGIVFGCELELCVWFVLACQQIGAPDNNKFFHGHNHPNNYIMVDKVTNK